MAKIDVKGLDEYMNRLWALQEHTEEVTKRAVYAGANVVADAVKKALNTIPIQEGDNGLPEMGTPENPLTGISRKQKADLMDSFGLAPIQEFKKGYISTKAGWDGYGNMKTKKYPQGVPNQMLMRSIESGTTFRKKNPVVRKAVNKVRKGSIKAMGEEIDKACAELMK